jgi:signal transduction histidine kinase
MTQPATFFDSPGRDTPAEITSQAALLDDSVLRVLEGLPEPTLLLNDCRQIVAANHAATVLAETLGGSAGVAGLRLGEAMGCVNVAYGPDGCGTAPQCPHCGAGRANRAFGIKPAEYEGEFRLRSEHDGTESAQTFHVHLAPLQLNGAPLRLLTLADITAEKSREALGHIFFHDVLNTAQAVKGAADLIPGNEDTDEREQLAGVVSASTRTLIREIESQRDLLLAADGELLIHLAPISIGALVQEAADLYRQNPIAAGREIVVTVVAADDRITTDRVQLSRCVGNLLKNALEASERGDQVSVDVAAVANSLRIVVHNPAIMPPAVQAQVFQRFFSTKASAGRGLGTYSVRLLVTRYLRGTVTFVSDESGTTFTIALRR